MLCFCVLSVIYVRIPLKTRIPLEGFILVNKFESNEFTIHYFCTHLSPPLPSSRLCYLLISGDASIHSSIYDPIEAHAERVDVAMMLPVLVLADQSSQLLGLILHHINSILQRAHFHLETNTLIHPLAFLERNYSMWGIRWQK